LQLEVPIDVPLKSLLANNVVDILVEYLRTRR